MQVVIYKPPLRPIVYERNGVEVCITITVAATTDGWLRRVLPFIECGQTLDNYRRDGPEVQSHGRVIVLVERTDGKSRYAIISLVTCFCCSTKDDPQ